MKKGLLERLAEGIVVGDGGMVMALEKRGYVNGATWTPEASAEHPEAVKCLHREFLRAGCDVLQTFTHYSTEDKITRGGITLSKFTSSEINDAACRNAREVADEGGALVSGSITQCPSYTEGKGKAIVQAQLRDKLKIFVEHKIDFIQAEFFENIEEMEWAIEEAMKTGLVVSATMAIGEKGDLAKVPPGQCAVRMAKAGAKVVGLNCKYDPDTILRTLAAMKEALEAEGLKPYLITQPNGFRTPGVGRLGDVACPEFPFAMEPRVLTRFEVHKYARAAYEMGVRYIGGCCGFEAYHIRAIAEELAQERGKWPPASDKHKPWGEHLKLSNSSHNHARAGRDYWENLIPASGLPGKPTHPLYRGPMDD